MLPDDPESTILKRLKKPKPEEDESQTGQRSWLDVPAPRIPTAKAVAGRPSEPGG
jgi:hypothetical protein